VNRRTLPSLLVLGLLAWTALASVGCSKRSRIVVESNTCWNWRAEGQGSTVSSDCGNASYKVFGKIGCVTIQNITDTGYVRIRIDEGAWAESSAPRGIAKVCQ
jgi:hypothetical protein